MKAFIVSDIRPFMQGLLSGDLFDPFELRSLSLSVLTHIEIDGAINENYLSEEDKEKQAGAFISWKEIQPKVRQLIAGGRTPSAMNLFLAYPEAARILSLPEGTTPQLNVRFQSKVQEGRILQSLTLYTAISSTTFSLDKTPERQWEEFVPTYFRGKNILLMEEES